MGYKGMYIPDDSVVLMLMLVVAVLMVMVRFGGMFFFFWEGKKLQVFGAAERSNTTDLAI